MASPPPFADVVSLYRAAGCPEWVGRRFQGDLHYPESRQLLARLHAQDASSGRFEEIKIDGHMALGEELPATGERVTFDFRTSTQEGRQFFRSADALADEYRPLGRGMFPDHFYLVTEDYYHDGHGEAPESVRNLEALTEFVKALEILADHTYETEGTGAWTLVYRTKDGLGLLSIEFSKELTDVKVPPLAWKVVRDLGVDVDSIHHKEKQWMFKARMCELLKEGLTLKEFTECGAEWATTYENDLQTYLSGFSFEEVKRKIADEHARFAEQVSKIFGDITVKVLSLPLSVAIAVVLKIQSGSLAAWLVILLPFVVTITITLLVRHYQRVVPRVEENIKLVFGKVERTGSARPKELDDRVTEVEHSLGRETRKLRGTLWAYLGLAWALPIIGIIVALC